MSYALTAEPRRGSRRWSHLCEPGLSPHRSNPTPPTGRDASTTTGGRRVPRRNEPETRQPPVLRRDEPLVAEIRTNPTCAGLDARPVGAVWSGSRRAHKLSWPRLCDPVAGVDARTNPTPGLWPKPAARDQPGRGRNPNEPEPGRRALAGQQDCGSTAPVRALAGLSRGDSRTNPRGYGQGTASAAACNGVIAAAPLRLDLAPASRHLQVSLHPRALVRKEAGWPRKT